MRIPHFCLGLALVIPGQRALANDEQPLDAASPEARAIAFLAREVPQWPARNRCFSCHNNGDAARALFAAGSLLPDRQAALAQTTDWLRRPEGWEHNGGEGEFNDRKLATLQFAFALAEAVRLGHVEDRQALSAAARKLIGFQEPDGSWKTDAEGTSGSPITYGRTLATVVARQTLLAAGGDESQPPLERAERWLHAQQPERVLDSAALLLAFPGEDHAQAAQRSRCLEIIRAGQDKTGGWGPFVQSRAEPFDTAVVLLALSGLPRSNEIERWIAAGRAYLLDEQQPDGSWIETTRPPGTDSYAHRISTTGWATLALLATRTK